MKILKIQTAPMELQCCHTHSATNSLLLWSIKQTVCRNTYIHSNATAKQTVCKKTYPHYNAPEGQTVCKKTYIHSHAPSGQTEQWKKGLLQKMFV